MLRARLRTTVLSKNAAQNIPGPIPRNCVDDLAATDAITYLLP